MAEYIAMLMDVLDIEFTVGTTSITLGAIAAATLILSAGVGFFRKIAGRR